MNIGRIFANALARRVAYVLVAAVLAWMVNEANAQSAPVSKAEAYAQCQSADHLYDEVPDVTGYRCQLSENDPPTTGHYELQYQQNGSWYQENWPSQGPNFHYQFICNSGEIWQEETHTCEQPNECSNQDPPLTGGSIEWPTEVDMTNNGGLTCKDSCEYGIEGTTLNYEAIDGKFHELVAGYTPTGNACEAGTGTGGAGPRAPGPNPPQDSDGDGSSDGNDSSPNNPGSGGGAGGGEQPAPIGEPGSGSGPGGGQGNNAGEGSGNGNTSGGGGNCSTPPSSSGDAILAQIAFQTWATRCAITANANQGNGNGEAGEGDGWEGEPGPFPDQGEGDDPEPADFHREATTPFSMIDQGGMLGPQQCPTFGSVTTRFGTVELDANGYWCQIIAVARVCILLLGAYISLNIVMGRREA